MVLLINSLTFPQYFFYSLNCMLFDCLFKWQFCGNSLMVQWFGLGPFTDEAQVQSLVWELWSHKPLGIAKKKKNKQQFCCTVSQFSRSVVSNSLQPHESQHARPPCPSPTPGVHSNSHPSSQWCHPAISSSVVLFSCSNPSQHQSLFQWVNSSHEVAKVLEFQL